MFSGCGFGFFAGSLLSARLARAIGPRAISAGTTLMGTGLLGIIWLAHAAQGAAPNLFLLWPILIWYGTGQGLALPTLVSAVVGNSRLPAQDAGSAAGMFTMLQQTAFSLGVATIMGLFFTAGPPGLATTSGRCRWRWLATPG